MVQLLWYHKERTWWEQFHRRGWRCFDRGRTAVWLLKPLQRKEVSHVVLWVTFLHLLEVLQGEVRELTRSQHVGRSYNGWHYHGRSRFRSWAMNVLNSPSSGMGVAWISGNENMSAFFW